MTELGTATEGRFVAYEYTRVEAPADREPLYRDTYANFGWELDGRRSKLQGADTVTLAFRRDRGINHRTDVAELQRTCETSLAAITKAERSVSSTAVAVAAMLGVVGAALLAGSIFALDADLTIVSIALGANGLFAWIAGYFAHGRVAAKQTTKIAQSVDDHYRIVRESSERAYTLLQDSTRERAADL